MKTHSVKPWHIKLGDTVGLWWQPPGHFSPVLELGKVVAIRKRRAIFHRGQHWTFKTDNPFLGVLSASRFDSVLRVNF